MATVLIVDDIPENIALVSSIMKGVCRTRVAISGEKALDIAFSGAPSGSHSPGHHDAGNGRV